jgi:DNA repair protein RadA/Sms
MFGEVGLAGEVRAVTQAGLRIREAAQMGFTRCVLPDANVDAARRSDARANADACELVGVRTLGEALDYALS